MSSSTSLKAGSLAILLIATPAIHGQESNRDTKPALVSQSVNLTQALEDLDRDFGDEDAAGDKWTAACSLFGWIKNVRTTENGYEVNLTGKRTEVTSTLRDKLAADGWTVVGESLAKRTFTLDLALNGELLSLEIIENADRKTSRVSALHFMAKITREKSSPVKKSLVSFEKTR